MQRDNAAAGTSRESPVSSSDIEMTSAERGPPVDPANKKRKLPVDEEVAPPVNESKEPPRANDGSSESNERRVNDDGVEAAAKRFKAMHAPIRKRRLVYCPFHGCPLRANNCGILAWSPKATVRVFQGSSIFRISLRVLACRGYGIRF